jgi:Domain of unknown function (DUF1995)
MYATMFFPSYFDSRQRQTRQIFSVALLVFQSSVLTAFQLTNPSFDRRSVKSHDGFESRQQSTAIRAAAFEWPEPPARFELRPGQPTELPDSLADAAVRAAEATKAYYDATTGGSAGMTTRVRVDFDTSIGDETFTILKQSTEFMQQYVTALSYALIPGLLEQRQAELMAVVQAKAELQALACDNGILMIDDRQQREDELVQLIASNGRNVSATVGRNGTVVRIYFPDEGSAALARRDWTPVVPTCVQFASCNGIQPQSQQQNQVAIQLFFCPRASDSDAVEALLSRAERVAVEGKQPLPLLTVFVNPVLVDMGVTGFGLAGRRLRERLLDSLVGVYYLRTLPWGALTRQWPAAYTLWQEDSNAVGGYKLLANLNNRLPSNPEVEDLYDIATSSNGNGERKSKGGNLLEQLGDFVNGMMRL